MLYYSTNQTAPEVNFKTATINGLAPDGGLYFPSVFPQMNKDFLMHLNRYSNEEIAYNILDPYVSDVINKSDLQQIITETINFDFPLIPITDKISCLELYHGPTLAFKDVGARFMSRCLGYFVKNEQREITVLVATSGDTGGAVADGFCGIEGVKVIILYPSGKVSPVQELQLTTHGNNIHVLEIDGTFDDCQKLVKTAFVDEEIKKTHFLTSANSINIARLLPQQLYYFFGYNQYKGQAPPVISVPSGNFGNICAGLIAQQAGLPVTKFIAACNANNIVPKFLKTGEYLPAPSISTLSNAMDVGNPSNIVRINEIFKNTSTSMHNAFEAYSFSDMETINAISRLHKEYNYTVDPHGAIGYLGLEKYLSENGGEGFFLETAHPIKFPEIVEKTIGSILPLPDSIQSLKSKKASINKLSKEFSEFKDYLLLL